MQLLEIKYNNEISRNPIDYCLFDETKMTLSLDDKVLVESGHEKKIGEIVSIKSDFLSEDVPPIISKVLKKASLKEIEIDRVNQEESRKALKFAQEQSKNLGLAMRFIDSYYTYDRKQLYLAYVSDNRVDFRELAKSLAQKYKTRIELRQIGVRDKAKKVGGLGPCGLFLCCSSFLTDFASVSINMAKNQFLALNPSKINGLCGRLLCCLTYEDEVYTDLKKGLPTVGSIIETKEGQGRVTSIDLFNQKYKVDIANKGEVEIKND